MPIEMSSSNNKVDFNDILHRRMKFADKENNIYQKIKLSEGLWDIFLRKNFKMLINVKFF